MRPGSLATPRRRAGALRITTPEGLARWTRGWGGAPEGATIFLPALLAPPGVRFYVMEAAGVVEAGLAALVDAEVAGYTNAFGPAAGIAARQAAIPAAEAGGRPLGGYEGGLALAAMTGLGFRPLGPLRVWSRRA